MEEKTSRGGGLNFDTIQLSLADMTPQACTHEPAHTPFTVQGKQSNVCIFLFLSFFLLVAHTSARTCTQTPPDVKETETEMKKGIQRERERVDEKERERRRGETDRDRPRQRDNTYFLTHTFKLRKMHAACLSDFYIALCTLTPPNRRAYELDRCQCT